MSDDSYKVVVQGIAEGRVQAEVANNLAACLKVDLKKTEIFFKGQPVVIKKGLSEQAAMKYKVVLEKAGVVVNVAAVAPSGAAASAPATKTAPAPPPPPDIKMMTCPKCGFEQPESHSCQKCGIAVEKFLKSQVEKEEALKPTPPPFAPGRGGFGQEDAAPGPPFPPGGPHGIPGILSDEEYREPVNFMEELPKVLSYPFSGKGPWIILAGVIFYVVVSYIPFMNLLLLFLWSGYFTSYMMKVVNASAEADPDPPNWPDVSSIAGDIIMPYIKLLWVIFVCIVPPVAVGFIMVRYLGMGRETVVPAMVLIALLSACYFPMALLAVAMSGNFLALNPLVVVPAIFKTIGQYIICLGALLITLVISGVANAYLRNMLAIPVIGPAISILLELYFWMVLMRILGLFYNANSEELEWYD